MAVTPILIGRNINFPRSYISGFVGSVGVTNMIYAGGFLRFDYLYPNYSIDLKIRPEFFTPSSNVYSVLYVIDWAASQTYFMGGSIPSSQGFKFVAMTTEPTWRLQVLATLAVDETQRLDLFPLPHYWRPLA